MRILQISTLALFPLLLLVGCGRSSKPAPSAPPSPSTSIAPATSTATAPTAKDVETTTMAAKPKPVIPLVVGEHIEALRRPPGEFNGICFRADGKLAALCGTGVRFFDVATRRAGPVVHSDDEGESTAVAFTPNGENLIVLYRKVNENKTTSSSSSVDSHRTEIVVLSSPDGKEVRRFNGLLTSRNMRDRVYVSPEGDRVAVSSWKEVAVFDLESGERVWSRELAKGVIGSYSALDVLPDWSLFMQRLYPIPYPEGDPGKQLTWDPSGTDTFYWDNLLTPDGRYVVAMGGGNGKVQRKIDLANNEVVMATTGVTTTVLAMHPKGDYLATAGSLWNLKDGTVKKMDIARRYDSGLAFSPDGSLLFSEDGTVDMTKAELKLTPFDNALRFTSNKLQIGVDDSGRFLLRTYDRRANKMKECMVTPSGEFGEPKDLANYHSATKNSFSAATMDGLISVSRQKVTYRNPAKPEAAPKVFSVPKGNPQVLPDLGVVIVTKTNVVVYNGPDGSVRHTVAADTGVSGMGSSIEASADGRRVLTSTSKAWRIYDFELDGTMVELKPARGGKRFNPTGTLLLRFEGDNATIRTRETGWKKPVSVKAPSGAIIHADASPDGTKLALSTKARMCHLFELKGGAWTLQATLLAPKIDDLYLFGADGALVAPEQEGENKLFYY